MFELRVQDENGNFKNVKWEGKDGEDACKRYAAAHPGFTVWAWRYPKYDIAVGLINIVQ